MVQPQLDTAASKATEIASAVNAVWAAKGAADDLTQANADGFMLRLKAQPEFALNKQGEIIGVDAWVQLFDPKGNEIPIDTHRRIVNPPVTHDGVRDPQAAFWAVLWDSVLSTPNPDGWVKS